MNKTILNILIFKKPLYTFSVAITIYIFGNMTIVAWPIFVYIFNVIYFDV